MGLNFVQLDVKWSSIFVLGLKKIIETFNSNKLRPKIETQNWDPKSSKAVIIVGLNFGSKFCSIGCLVKFNICIGSYFAKKIRPKKQIIFIKTFNSNKLRPKIFQSGHKMLKSLISD